MALGDALKNLQSNTDITPEEMSENALLQLKTEIEACTPEQSAECIAILEAAIPRAQGDAKKGLQTLRDNIETQGVTEYSMESLIENMKEDEKAQAFLGLYNSVIAEDLGKLYGNGFNTLSPSGQETIKLMFWDKIQSQLSLKGIINMGVGGMKSLTGGFTELFGSSDDEVTGSILTARLEEKMKNPLINLPDEAKKDIDGMVDVVESLIGKEANNIATLFTLTDRLSKEYKNAIFENPIILTSIASSGAYKNNGFDIDLKSKKIQIGEVQDIPALQKTFIEKLGKDSKNVGASIEKMKKMSDKMDKILKKFGMEGGLDEMKEVLFGIPIVGVLFKMIFGDFFDQFDKAKTFEKLLDKVGDNDTQKSLKNLKDTFIPKYLEDKENVDSPLGKIFSSLGGDIVTKTGPFFETLTTAGIDTKKPDFWNNILIGGGEIESAESKIHEYLSPILSSDTLDEKKLVAHMNALPTDILPIKKGVTEESTVSLEGVTSLPAVIEYKGEEITIEAFNSADSTIKIGERFFQISKILPAADDADPSIGLDIENIGINEEGPFIKPKKKEAQKIPRNDLEKVIMALLETGAYTLRHEVDTGLGTMKIKIEIFEKK